MNTLFSLVVLGSGNLISVMISILLIVVVFWVIWWILDRMKLPEPIRTVVTIILGIVAILALLKVLGLY